MFCLGVWYHVLSSLTIFTHVFMFSFMPSSICIKSLNNWLRFLSINSILCHLLTCFFCLDFLLVVEILFFFFSCQVIYYWMINTVNFTFFGTGFCCVPLKGVVYCSGHRQGN